MMYDINTVLSATTEYNQLKRVNNRFSGALKKYRNYTIAQFIYDYHHFLKGKEVYDKLMAAVAPDILNMDEDGNANVNRNEPVDKFSIEDLLQQEKRALPYVSNVHQSIGKLMDIAISQAISITVDHPQRPTSSNYGKALQMFFVEHLDRETIAARLNCSYENARKSFISNFITGHEYVEKISIDESFKKAVTSLVNSLLYCVCDSTFEDNDINTLEKREFACALAGKDFFNDMSEWGNVFVVTDKDAISVTKKHLASLKQVICSAIVPIKFSDLIERTKTHFITKNNPASFNPQIIERFVNSHPWIEKDDKDKYYISTPHLILDYQRQGRIIYEEGGDLIHYSEVKKRYEAIYGETYRTNGVNSYYLGNRPEHDFFPYGRTGQWYYSENGTPLTTPNEAITKFVDKTIAFYWTDLSEVVSELLRSNKNLNKRRIRLELTNLCYTDKANPDHFVKKGEENNYPEFCWNKARQSRVNWMVNYVYELLKDKPEMKMPWTDFEKQFMEAIKETGRTTQVLETLKYSYSGPADKERLFIRENDIISLNEEVFRNAYNSDLSMVGLYRKHLEYYDSIFSLAITELRKQPENSMALVDFIALAVDTIESEGTVDSGYIRKIFERNDNLPEGLSRYNKDGSVFIKLDLAVADAETKNDIQYEVSIGPADDSQIAPSLVVSNTTREPVTFATIFNWDDVKKALQKDLCFYNRWFDGFTSDEVLDFFVEKISKSQNYNLNHVLPQIIYEFHYARIGRYDLYQYIRNLPIAFEALLREIYESCHRPIQAKGIYELCREGFTEYADAIRDKDKNGFGGILCDLVYKRNLLVHGKNLELSIVTLNKNIVEYIALFVYTVKKYALIE